jgi:hypothetical protein
MPHHRCEKLTICSCLKWMTQVGLSIIGIAKAHGPVVGSLLLGLWRLNCKGVRTQICVVL